MSNTKTLKAKPKRSARFGAAPGSAMVATFPETRTAEEELRLMRSHMRVYAICWKEHRCGMERHAEVELMQAIARRDAANRFALGLSPND